MAPPVRLETGNYFKVSVTKCEGTSAACNTSTSQQTELLDAQILEGGLHKECKVEDIKEHQHCLHFHMPCTDPDNTSELCNQEYSGNLFAGGAIYPGCKPQAYGETTKNQACKDGKPPSDGSQACGDGQAPVGTCKQALSACECSMIRGYEGTVNDENFPVGCFRWGDNMERVLFNKTDPEKAMVNMIGGCDYFEEPNNLEAVKQMVENNKYAKADPGRAKLGATNYCLTPKDRCVVPLPDKDEDGNPAEGGNDHCCTKSIPLLNHTTTIPACVCGTLSKSSIGAIQYKNKTKQFYKQTKESKKQIAGLKDKRANESNTEEQMISIFNAIIFAFAIGVAMAAKDYINDLLKGVLGFIKNNYLREFLVFVVIVGVLCGAILGVNATITNIRTQMIEKAQKKAQQEM